MAFQRFEPGAQKGGPIPFVSYYASGHVAFSVRAQREFGIEAGQWCVLHYDPSTRRVGLQYPVPHGTPHAYKICKMSSEALGVRLSALLKVYSIPLIVGTRMPIVRDAETGLLVFTLPDFGGSSSSAPQAPAPQPVQAQPVLTGEQLRRQQRRQGKESPWGGKGYLQHAREQEEAEKGSGRE